MPKKEGICSIFENSIRKTPGIRVKFKPNSAKALEKSMEIVLLGKQILTLDLDNLIKLGCDDQIKSLKEGI